MSAESNVTTDRDFEVIDAAVRGGGSARPEDAELVDFALLVRGARQVPDHGTAQRLDARLSGDATKAPHRRSGFRAVLAITAGVAVMVFGALVVTEGGLDGIEGGDTISNLAATDTTTSLRTPAVPNANSAPESLQKSLGIEQQSALRSTNNLTAADNASAKAAMGGSETLLGTTADSPSRDRKQSKQATLTIAVSPKRIDEVADDIAAIADRAGGYVVDASVRKTGSNYGRGEFQLMIPVEKYDGVLASITQLGHVRRRQQTMQDVTAEYNRTARRLADSRSRVNSLEKELAGATSDQQRATIEQKLRRARVTVRNNLAAARAVRTRVNYVPMHVELVSDAKAEDGDKGAVAKAFDRAGEILTTVLAWLIVALAVILPIALVAAFSIWLWRRLHRSRADRTIDAASATRAEQP
jgi:hypothetical protein